MQGSVSTKGGDGNALLVDLHGVLVPEGGLANQELIDEDAECPPVDGAAVT